MLRHHFLERRTHYICCENLSYTHIFRLCHSRTSLRLACCRFISRKMTLRSFLPFLVYYSPSSLGFRESQSLLKDRTILHIKLLRIKMCCWRESRLGRSLIWKLHLRTHLPRRLHIFLSSKSLLSKRLNSLNNLLVSCFFISCAESNWRLHAIERIDLFSATWQRGHTSLHSNFTLLFLVVSF